jgi:antitoxin component YwqK of YwqJK toxin-antitoxin module
VNGVDKEYYESGILQGEAPYKNDKENGIEKLYYESGKLKTETPYTNGNAGVTINYDENGNEIK